MPIDYLARYKIIFVFFSLSLSSLHAIETVFRVCVQLVLLCEFFRLHCANRTARVDAENCARENVSAKGTNVIEREILTACIYFPLGWLLSESSIVLPI